MVGKTLSHYQILVAASLGLLSIACDIAPPPTGEVAIVDVTIIDVETGAVEPAMDVVIGVDRIAAVGPTGSLDIAAETTRVSGEGRFLVPGFWDMHIHVSGPEPQPRTIDLPLYIANGVTGIRFMSGDCAIDCELEAGSQGSVPLDIVRAWERDIEAGTLVGPRIAASSLMFDGTPPTWPGTYALDDASEGREAVRDAVRRGADFLKIQSPPPDVYYAVVDEAQAAGIDVVGHVPAGVTVAEASTAGQKSVEHFDSTELMACSSAPQEALAARARGSSALSRVLLETFDEASCAPFLDLLKENNTWHVPTLSYYRTAARLTEVMAGSADRLVYFPRGGLTESWWARQLGFLPVTGSASTSTAAMFRLRLDYVGAAHRAGVQLLAGTDAWNPYVFAGFSLHDELELFVEAGMSPLEALRTATVAAAVFFGREGEMGAVRPGYLADLVLLEANPAENIENTRSIAAVVANGRFFDREMLDDLLAGVSRATGALPEEARRPPSARDRLVWIDRRGDMDPVPGEARDYGVPRLAPDGRQVAVQATENRQTHIWLLDVTTGAAQRLTSVGQRNANAVWSPDGRWVYFASDRGGDQDIWRKPPDPGAEAEVVYRAPGGQSPGSISPDGAWLVFFGSSDGGAGRDIGLVSLAQEAAVRWLVTTPEADEWWPVFSPDGRFVAYESDDTGLFQVYVHEIATGTRWMVSTDESGWGASFPHWTRNGTEIVYMSSGQPFAVDVKLGPEPSFSAPRQLFRLPPWPKLVPDVTPDGERFLLVHQGSRLRRD